MKSYYEVRGTPVATGIPTIHSMRKRNNAVKKAQQMVRSGMFYFVSIWKSGQHILDFNGQTKQVNLFLRRNHHHD